MKICAYCRKSGLPLEREHVVPRSLYPKSRAASKVQRLTVWACRQCNNAWSNDEAHFRNMMVIAGEPNDPVKELWSTTVKRGFQQIDGKKRIEDLFSQFVPTVVDGENRYMVYPGRDERVLRVIRKIIRGLCFHHGISPHVADEQILADVLTHIVPAEYIEMMEYHHLDQDVFEYRFAVLDTPEIDSAWLLTFFQQRSFIACVLAST